MAGPTTRTIGSFQVEQELAQGGMGVVYLAHQPALGRRAVLKTLRKELADDERLNERFRREAEAAAAVHHENVVAVYDGFSFRGRSYIAQEYVDGENLETALGRSGPLPPRVAAWLALEIARGLEAIHARGVVHRDLKPSNVLVAKTGQAKIADFGIALGSDNRALTQTGHAIGTPRYMSPEQLYGERVDPRSDLFAWGVVLYEMLAGRGPFMQEEPEGEGDALVKRIEAGSYTPVRRAAKGVPRPLARLVARCLRAKPKKRPSSAAELRVELERFLAGASIAEGRHEVSTFLWSREVFQREGRETVAAPPAEPKPRRSLRGLRWAAAVAALAAALAGAWLRSDRSDLSDLSKLSELPLLARAIWSVDAPEAATEADAAPE